MKKTERQALLDRFVRWFQSEFLADEERMKGRQYTDAERECHIQKVVQMFAAFVLMDKKLDGVALPHDVGRLLASYGNHLRASLGPNVTEEELLYYFWPVSLLLSGDQAYSECN